MGLKLNVSAKEAKSEVLEPIPAGWYKVVLSDVELKEVKNAPQPGKKDNRGEPFYSIEHTVSEGKYEGRKVFSNVMLFEGALYTAVQLAKAMGIYSGAEGEELVIPDADELTGTEVWAKVKITGERTVRNQQTGESTTYEKKNEIAGYSKNPLGAAGGTGTGTSSAGNSLLPS